MPRYPSDFISEAIREPDILFVTPENFPSDTGGYPSRPDQVMEIVSHGTDARKRDYEDKRSDYAQARIPEYWIVDFENSSIVEFTLDGDRYQEFSRSTGAAPAQSKRPPGFQTTPGIQHPIQRNPNSFSKVNHCLIEGRTTDIA